MKSELFKELTDFINKYHIPNYASRQFFIVDSDLIAKIAEELNVSAKDSVLVIGSNPFVLRALQDANKISVFEEDENSREMVIGQKFGKVEVLSAGEKISGQKFDKILILNNIENEFLVELLKTRFKKCLVVATLSFADRLLSFPGLTNYTQMPVIVQTYCEVGEKMKINADSFFPKPQDQHMLIKLEARKKVLIGEKQHDLFYEFLKTIFRFKNKDLTKALGLCINEMYKKNKKLDKGKILKNVEKIKIGENKVYLIEVDDLAKIFNTVFG